MWSSEETELINNEFNVSFSDHVENEESKTPLLYSGESLILICFSVHVGGVCGDDDDDDGFFSPLI